MLNCFRCHFWFTIKFKCYRQRLMVNDSWPCLILSLQAWFYRTVYIVTKSQRKFGVEELKIPKEKNHSLPRYKQEEQVMCQLDSWGKRNYKFSDFFMIQTFTGIFSQDPARKVVPRHNTSFVRLCTRAKEMKEFGWIVIWEQLRGGMIIESLS